MERLRQWARRLKRDVVAVWLAARDPRVPWQVKALAVLVAAYALSPIDLIPDFIPVLGLLDDLLLVPAGIWLVVRLLPPHLMAELRHAAEQRGRIAGSRSAAALIVLLWLVLAGATWVWLGGWLPGQ